MDEKKKPKCKYSGFSVYYRAEKKKWYAEIQRLSAKNGPRRKYFSANTEKEVVKMATGFLKNERDQYKEEKTVAEYIRKWFFLMLGNCLKPSSYNTKINTIENHIIPRIGQYRMCEITAEDIQSDLINDMIESGYSYSTIKKAYEAANACFRYASKSSNLHIPFNPMDDVMLPKKSIIPPKEKIAFTREEAERFQSVCFSKNSKGGYIHPKGPFFIFLLKTGMRLGEAMALRWKDVDMEKKLIHVSRNVVYTKNRNTGRYSFYEQNTPKTKRSNRIIPFGEDVNKILINVLPKERNDETLVFGNTNGSFLRENNLIDSFHIVTVKAETRQADIHTLRHSFATNLIRNGVEISIVSSLLGHASISITYDTYIHVIEEQKALAIQETLFNLPHNTKPDTKPEITPTPIKTYGSLTVYRGSGKN